MKPDKTFKCKRCGRYIRIKAISMVLADLQLCPQCFTKGNKEGYSEQEKTGYQLETQETTKE